MSTLVIEQRERDRRSGLIGTIVFHVLLTLLFLFFGLQQPNPLPEEEGIELAMADFGTTTTGSGNTESPDPGDSQSSAAASPTTDRSTPEDVATQEDSPVEQVKPKEKPKDKPREQPKPDKPKPDKPKEPTISDPLKEALSQWGKGGGQPGDGQDQTPGNVGTPTGQPEGLGTFHGNGWSVSLGGRGLLKGPNITDRPEIDRRTVVVITIKVDREGKVTSAFENLSKSNTTSQVLFNIAKKAARQANFSAKPDGPFEQQGEMTFIFDPQ